MVSGLEPLTPDRYSAFVVDGESTAPLLTGYLPRCVSVGAETLELVHRSTDGRMTVLVSLRSNLANKTRRSITFPSTVSTFTANLTGSFFCNASVGQFPDVSSSRQYDLYIQSKLMFRFFSHVVMHECQRRKITRGAHVRACVRAGGWVGGRAPQHVSKP